jgi:16S rRNA (guanine527-N7)-methyltransferase
VDEKTRLIAASRSLGVALSGAEAETLLQLLDELEHWGRAYNLTAISARESMVTHHLLDSLSVNGDLRGTRIADVGTGAGFPGLPLAVVNPGRRFWLIDSNAKKLRFVSHAARAMGLVNVQTVHARVEEMAVEAPFDTVIARAFAPLAILLERLRPICAADTRVLAMKGKRPQAEIAAIPPGWRVLEVRELHVPQLDEARHLVVAARLP